jgi:hypothetical protein
MKVLLNINNNLQQQNVLKNKTNINPMSERTSKEKILRYEEGLNDFEERNDFFLNSFLIYSLKTDKYAKNYVFVRAYLSLFFIKKIKCCLFL